MAAVAAGVRRVPRLANLAENLGLHDEIGFHLLIDRDEKVVAPFGHEHPRHRVERASRELERGRDRRSSSVRARHPVAEVAQRARDCRDPHAADPDEVDPSRT